SPSSCALPLAVCGPAPVTRFPGPVPGTCFADPYSPWPPPFAPPTPQRIAPLCSSASQLIWRSLTSRTRTSSATAPRLPDANQDSLLPLVRRGISRFPRNELVHMPGSSTTPGRPGTRVAVPVRIAFRLRNGVDAQGMNLYEAQWLAYALPYRRFAAVLTDCDARLGADRIATPSSYRTCTDCSLPVSRRTAKDSVRHQEGPTISRPSPSTTGWNTCGRCSRSTNVTDQLRGLERMVTADTWKAFRDLKGMGMTKIWSEPGSPCGCTNTNPQIE